jgi:hypothetical protein
MEKFAGGGATVSDSRSGRGIHGFNIKNNPYPLITEINYKTGKIFLTCAAALIATLARKGVRKTCPTHEWMGSRVMVGANPGR